MVSFLAEPILLFYNVRLLTNTDLYICLSKAITLVDESYGRRDSNQISRFVRVNCDLNFLTHRIRRPMYRQPSLFRGFWNISYYTCSYITVDLTTFNLQFRLWVVWLHPFRCLRLRWSFFLVQRSGWRQRRAM